MNLKLPIDTDAELSSALISQFGFNQHNYTLYPEPSYFVEAFDTQAYLAWVNNRKIGSCRRALSLSVHIPFCNALSFCCQQNQILTNDQTAIKRYLDYLSREISLQGKLFQGDTKVEQLYFSSGIPAYLDEIQLGGILHEIRQNFNLTRYGEYLIEIDPRQVTRSRLRAFSDLGFNCVNIGIYDFTQQVQQAMHRFQSEQDTLYAIQAAKQEGIKSIRIELLYGLPKQGLKEFSYTLEQIINANPNQINLLSYLHLPEKFKPQRRINGDDLPSKETKLESLQFAISRLIDAGYIHIGMNLFAKQDDPLVTAQRQGRLNYNTRGFTIYPDSNLVALGASSIGSVGPTLIQNHCDLLQYYDKLEYDQIPIMRGFELSADDLLRRTVIHALICHSVLSFESIETTFPIDFKHYFATELIELMVHERAGLLAIADEEIAVTSIGRLLISSICMVFDKYQRVSRARCCNAMVI
ncbi:MAG: oxygen-independent coproporphyrinogen III oxidase [Betaproteobacteria bacterium]|nr:oxygen-independent coproporphyrinogen III oxidase [Betaproteobacteria bacterium]